MGSLASAQALPTDGGAGTSAQHARTDHVLTAALAKLEQEKEQALAGFEARKQAALEESKRRRTQEELQASLEQMEADAEHVRAQLAATSGTNQQQEQPSENGNEGQEGQPLPPSRKRSWCAIQ